MTAETGADYTNSPIPLNSDHDRVQQEWMPPYGIYFQHNAHTTTSPAQNAVRQITMFRSPVLSMPRLIDFVRSTLSTIVLLYV